MNSIIKSTLLCALAVAPMLSFAQTQEVTRAQVYHELVQLEKAGYDPSSSNLHYPDNLQKAEAKVAAEQTAVPNQSLAHTDTQAQAGTDHLPGQSIYFGD